MKRMHYLVRVFVLICLVVSLFTNGLNPISKATAQSEVQGSETVVPTTEPPVAPTEALTVAINQFQNELITFDYSEGMALFSKDDQFISLPLEIDLGGQLVAGLIDPGWKQDKSLSSSIQIYRHELPVGSTLDAVISAAYQPLPEPLTKESIAEESGPVTLAGLSATQLTYRVQANSVSYKMQDVWVEKEGSVFRISFWQDESVTNFAASADLLRSSLVIKDNLPPFVPEPTTAPVVEPTAVPTEEPTEVVTEEPTAAPTEEPTAAPTEEPTATATSTSTPTSTPTSAPTSTPTTRPVTLAPLKNADSPDAIPNQYIVVLKSGTDAPARTADMATEVSKLGGKIRDTYTAAFSGFSAYLPGAALQAMRSNPNVDYITVNRTITLSENEVPRSIVQTGATWGLDRIDQATGLNGNYTYNYSGAGVNVYIIDTGITPNHTLFGGRAYQAYNYFGDGTYDCNGHGTHVAGIVGSSTYGVAKNARLMGIKVFQCSSSTTLEAIIGGVNWVTAYHVHPAVVNMSLGAGVDDLLDAAVIAMINEGITVVVAAGNESSDACFSSPARIGPAITVGSSTSSDYRSSFSNYGTCVDIFAPGSDILSTYYTSNSATYTMSGTSMASPFVAGAAAVYLQSNPGATPATVMSALIAASTKNELIGIGTGSPNRLLYINPIITPEKPVLVSVANGSSIGYTPALTWNAAIGANTYLFQLDNNSNFSSPIVSTSLSGTSYTPAALHVGTYYWHVRGINQAAGVGYWSLTFAFTIVPAPAPMLTAPVSNSISKGTPTFAWNAVSGATQYMIQIDNNSNFSSPAYSVVQAGRTYKPPSLAIGTYYWHVRAINSLGDLGYWSPAPIVIVQGPPGPVLISPAHADIIYTAITTPGFTWAAANSATLYTIQIDNDADFSSPVFSVNTAGLSTYTMSLGSTGVFYWRVRGYNTFGSPGYWSESRVVYLSNKLPPPSLVSPVNNVTVDNESPSFSWSAVSTATCYQFQMDNNSDFSSPALTSPALYSTSYSPTIANGIYYWRVRTCSINGLGLWSTARKVTLSSLANWTVLIYLAADNNLEGAAIDDFLEMAQVGSNSNLNIIVQLDRVAGHDARYGDWTGTRRYRVTSGMTPTTANAITNLGEINMGNPDSLKSFINWGKTTYPASNYAVIIWNHGSGFQPQTTNVDLEGISWDDTNGNDYLTNVELTQVLGSVTAGGASPLELLGFDACLMSMVEVDQHIKNYTKTRVASQDLTPYDGWPYETFLADLKSHLSWNGVTLANDIVNRYAESYSSTSIHPDSVTLSAVQFGSTYNWTIATAFGNFVAALRNNLATESGNIANARAATQYIYDTSYIDLYDFAYQVSARSSNAAIDSAASTLMSSLDTVITNDYADSTDFPRAHGVSIFFPDSQSTWGTWASSYQTYQYFARDTMWNEFLNEYFGSSITITLTWGANPNDLDSHLWLPAATPYHIYYMYKGTLTAFPWANLDVDDTSSYGPENISIKQTLPGVYNYAVFHYSGTGSIKTSGAVVRVYRNGTLIKTINASTATGTEGGAHNTYWDVFAYNGTTGNLVVTNNMRSTPPRAATSKDEMPAKK